MVSKGSASSESGARILLLGGLRAFFRVLHNFRFFLRRERRHAHVIALDGPSPYARSFSQRICRILFCRRNETDVSMGLLSSSTPLAGYEPFGEFQLTTQLRSPSCWFRPRTTWIE